MTIDELKAQGLLLLECISGSKAYGLDLPGSDTDLRGVYILPQQMLYGLEDLPQVADERNDEVYYELGRFVELLGKSNPNLLEMLATPADKVLFRHPLMDQLPVALFLSKRCKHSFGGFALTQIRKAKGLNKKIINPVEKERKSPLDFCFVLRGAASLPVKEWLQQHSIPQEHCGLVNVPHARDLYALFVDQENTFGYKGIIQKLTSNTVSLSSIPKGEEVAAYLYFNKDGYTTYCKDYRQYWDWVEKRNEDRYQNTLNHGHGYDTKNMMHTFRLLDMAEEILRTGKLHVRRPNREELLAIRRGKWTYEELMSKAEARMRAVDEAYAKSTLPDEPDMMEIARRLVQMREEFYER